MGKLGLIGWVAIVLSTLTLSAAALLAYLVVTTKPAPPPKVEEPPSDPLLIAQEVDDRFLLPIEKATLDGKDLAIEQRAVGKVIGGWKSQEDRISWRLKLRKAGIYEIHLTYSNARADGEPAGKYQFQCGEEKITASARPTKGVEHSVTDKVFLKLGPQGEVMLELSATSIPGGELMTIKSVELHPRLYQRKKKAATSRTTFGFHQENPFCKSRLSEAPNHLLEPLYSSLRAPAGPAPWPKCCARRTRLFLIHLRPILAAEPTRKLS